MSTESKECNQLLFLGLPKSGKTTYFTIMVDHLQRHVNSEKSKYKFHSEPSEGNKETTSEFVRRTMNDIKNQKWPIKTQKYIEAYRFALVKRNEDVLETEKLGLKHIFNPWKWSDKSRTKCVKKDVLSIIHYHDYPGEAFEQVKYDCQQPSENQSNGSNPYRKSADELRDKIKSADGIFLILDAESLDASSDYDGHDNTILKLFRYIKDQNKDVKLAVIINKLEVFAKSKVVYGEKSFKDDYSDVHANRPKNSKFFGVYTLGSLDQNDEGEWIPPKRLEPKGILEPLEWMLGMSEVGFNEKI